LPPQTFRKLSVLKAKQTFGKLPSVTRMAVKIQREFRLNQPNFIKSMKELFMQHALVGLLGLQPTSKVCNSQTFKNKYLVKIY